MNFKSAVTQIENAAAGAAVVEASSIPLSGLKAGVALGLDAFNDRSFGAAGPSFDFAAKPSHG